MDSVTYTGISLAACGTCVFGFIVQRAGISEFGWDIQYMGIAVAFTAIIARTITMRRERRQAIS